MKNATVVIKYGGHAMDKPELSSAFAADLAQLTEQGMGLVVVARRAARRFLPCSSA